MPGREIQEFLTFFQTPTTWGGKACYAGGLTLASLTSPGDILEESLEL